MKKKQTKKSTRKPRRKIPRNLPLAGFPKQKMVRLRYVQEQEITTSPNGLSHSVPFVANGCHDPYYPIGGHQPKGFDQWMAVYSHFNVLGSKISVKMVGTGEDNFAWGVARTAAPNTLNGQTLEYILEWRGNKSSNSYVVVGSENGGYANNPTRMNTVKTARYSQKKQFGKNATSTAELIGSATSNPAELSIFEIWQCPINSQMASKTADYVVVIDYIVLFTEPKLLPQS